MTITLDEVQGKAFAIGWSCWNPTAPISGASAAVGIDSVCLAEPCGQVVAARAHGVQDEGDGGVDLCPGGPEQSGTRLSTACITQQADPQPQGTPTGVVEADRTVIRKATAEQPVECPPRALSHILAATRSLRRAVMIADLAWLPSQPFGDEKT